MASNFAHIKQSLLIGATVAALVGLYSLALPNWYRSEGKILPMDARSSSSGFGGFASAAAALGVSLPGGDSGDGNFVDILQSRQVMENVLRKEYHFKEKPNLIQKETDHNETLLTYLKVSSMDRGIGKLKQIVQISKDPKTKVISLSSETPSPLLSQQVTQEFFAQLEIFVQQRSRTRGGAKAVFAEARLAETRKTLLENEVAYIKFCQANRNYQTSGDPVTRTMGLRLEADLKLQQQMVLTLSTSREQALMEEKNDMPVVNVMDTASLPSEKSKPARLKLVIGILFLGSLMGWLFFNREELLKRIRAFGEPGVGVD